MGSFVSVLSPTLTVLATDYAQKTECDLIDSYRWEQLSPGSTVVAFGDRHQVTPELLYRARGVGVRGVDVGFITGRSSGQIATFAARNHQLMVAPSPRPLRTLSLEPMSMEPSDVHEPLHWILRGPDASQEAVWDYVREAPCDVLTIMAHGRDDNVYLADATICGRTLLVQRSQDSDSHFPACSFGHLCHKDKPLVMAAELPVRIVFINACFGLKTQDATFQGDYTLALGFAEGFATHVVASDTMQPGQPYYNQVFVNRLRKGWPVGRAVAALNAEATSRRLDVSRFNLLGDPRFSPMPSTVPHPAPRLVYEVGSPPQSVQSDAVALGHRITALQQVPHLRLPVPQWSGRMLELERRFFHFIERYRATLHESEPVAAISHSLRSLARTCDLLDQQLLDYLLDKTNRHNFHFVENYREQMWVGTETTTQCVGCGGWAMTYPLREYYTPEPFRQIVDCPQCGIVQETPPDPLVTTALEFRSTIRKGQPWTVDIAVTSHADWPMPVRVVVGVAEGLRRAIQFIVEPSSAQLPPHETIHFTASSTIPLDAPALREHNYWLRAYTVANSALYFDHRNFWVVSPEKDIR